MQFARRPPVWNFASDSLRLSLIRLFASVIDSGLTFTLTSPCVWAFQRNIGQTAIITDLWRVQKKIIVQPGRDFSPLGGNPASQEGTPASQEESPASREKTPASQDETPASQKDSLTSQEAILVSLEDSRGGTLGTQCAPFFFHPLAH